MKKLLHLGKNNSRGKKIIINTFRKAPQGVSKSVQACQNKTCRASMRVYIMSITDYFCKLNRQSIGYYVHIRQIRGIGLLLITVTFHDLPRFCKRIEIFSYHNCLGVNFVFCQTLFYYGESKMCEDTSAAPQDPSCRSERWVW